jgi:hypothetical protein
MVLYKNIRHQVSDLLATMMPEHGYTVGAAEESASRRPHLPTLLRWVEAIQGSHAGHIQGRHPESGGYRPLAAAIPVRTAAPLPLFFSCKMTRNAVLAIQFFQNIARSVFGAIIHNNDLVDQVWSLVHAEE